MLTVVTASHCNSQGLRSLAEQILPRLGHGLRWVVKDSGACSETSQWAATTLAQESGVSFDASPDVGIYDALNRALSKVTTDYYLVVGSDDAVDGGALVDVARTLRARAPGVQPADILTFPVRTSAGLRRRKRFRPRWVSSSSLVTSHSVGTLIRRDLHDRLGPYDTRYHILADSLFLRQAWLAGAQFEHRVGPVLGSFSLNGVSSRDHGRRLVETYSYLSSTGSPRWLQSCLLWLRLMRFRPPSLL